MTVSIVFIVISLRWSDDVHFLGGHPCSNRSDGPIAFVFCFYATSDTSGELLLKS